MVTKKTKTQEYIDIAVSKAAKAATKGNSITGCSFVGVQFDAKAVGAVQTIAEGLVENAKALSKLAEVLKASNVTVECLLKVEGI
jgi:hypothetical protein